MPSHRSTGSSFESVVLQRAQKKLTKPKCAPSADAIFKQIKAWGKSSSSKATTKAGSALLQSLCKTRNGNRALLSYAARSPPQQALLCLSQRCAHPRTEGSHYHYIRIFLH